MKKQIAYMLSVLLVFTLYSCGGSSGGPHLGGASSQSGYQLTSNSLALYFDPTDPTKDIVPFPNDILLQSTENRAAATPQTGIYIPTTGVTDPATLAFYTAINKLYLQGLSPNTPITIPLATNTIQLNQQQLQNNITAIDITRFVGKILYTYLRTYLYQKQPSDQDYCSLYYHNSDNKTLALGCADTILGYYSQTSPSTLQTFLSNVYPAVVTPLIVKQNGNVINGYPAVPFNPGDQYAVAVKNGIDKLQSSTLAQLLIGDKPLTGSLAPLEKLRQSYVGLLPLFQAVGIPKDNILEMFTFKVASKTLGLNDYGQILDVVKGIKTPSEMVIKGYPYAYLDNMTYSTDNTTDEYMNKIDPLSDLPLVCSQVPGLQITDNKTYFKDINVNQLSIVGPIALNLKENSDNSTIVATDCYKIFDNATLYDNVTTAIYGNTSNPSGIIIFQHGFGRDKSDAGILANDPNLENYEIFAMDLPWHGDRIPPYYVDNQTEKEQLIKECPKGKCYLTSNPISDVMNIYQSLLDMHTFTKLVYAGDAKTMAAYGQPPLPVYFVGQSMGSITGSMLLNLDNITYSAALASSQLPVNNYISKAVLNVGGANYSAILTNATNPEIMGLLCSALKIPTNQCTPANVAKYRDTISYNMTIALFQLVLDPVDPAFMARNPSIKDKVLLQSAYHDTLVPNTSNEILYNDYNTPAFPYTRFSPQIISCSSTGVLANSGWYMYKGASPYDWINHGFIVHTADTLDELNEMYPSAAGHMSLECVNSAEELSRQQVNDFFSQ